MGYQLFSGGHEADENEYQFRPDQKLVPGTKQIHETIDEVGYKQGDKTDEEGKPLGTHGRMDLQLAINERSFNEGYDEVNGPVVIDNLEETEDGWECELYEDSNWTRDKGYPSQAS